MYILTDIIKAYKSQTVLENFNYIFPEKGLCLLVGRSGSGKSTLLNLLSGIEPPDSGTIWYRGQSYSKGLGWDDVSEVTDYITQTVYLPQYLTAFDCMKMVCADDEKINKALEEFCLDKLLDKQVRFCSGGERQRLAIVRSLLAQKSVILLDEPTASLDYRNKQLVFEMLKRIAKEKLVICATHDPCALEYADRVIDFNHLEFYQDNKGIPEAEEENDIQIVVKSDIEKAEEEFQDELYPYIKKWFVSDMRSKTSGRIMTVLTGVILIFLCLCSTPGEKIESCIKHFYRSNAMLIWCTGDNWREVYNLLESQDSVIDYGLLYNMSVNDTGVGGQAASGNQMDYDLTANTLPYYEDAFLYSDHIVYGHYFTKPEQVLLSYEKAVRLGDPERLIGSKLHMDLYGGSYDMEIAGVFSSFNSAEESALYLSGVDMDTNFEREIVFLNSEFMKRYLEDETFYMHGQRVFSVFFSDYSGMKAFFDEYRHYIAGVRMSYTEVPLTVRNIFTYMSLLLIPLFVLFIPVIILFYQQSRKLELSYNRQIFACFDYLGYTKKQVRDSFVRCNALENGKRFLLCLVVICPFMLIINYMNQKLFFFPFEIFTIRPFLIFACFVFMGVLDLVMFMKAMRSIKTDGWYKAVKEYEDMI